MEKVDILAPREEVKVATIVKPSPYEAITINGVAVVPLVRNVIARKERKIVSNLFDESLPVYNSFYLTALSFISLREKLKYKEPPFTVDTPLKDDFSKITKDISENYKKEIKGIKSWIKENEITEEQTIFPYLIQDPELLKTGEEDEKVISSLEKNPSPIKILQCVLSELSNNCKKKNKELIEKLRPIPKSSNTVNLSETLRNFVSDIEDYTLCILELADYLEPIQSIFQEATEGKREALLVEIFMEAFSRSAIGLMKIVHTIFIRGLNSLREEAYKNGGESHQQIFTLALSYQKILHCMMNTEDIGLENIGQLENIDQLEDIDQPKNPELILRKILQEVLELEIDKKALKNYEKEPETLKKTLLLDEEILKSCLFPSMYSSIKETYKIIYEEIGKNANKTLPKC